MLRRELVEPERVSRHRPRRRRRERLRRPRPPVWLKLAETKTELFREVRRIYRGVSPALATAWDLPSDTTFWARHYIFWYHRRPLCVIHEVMSPRLERYLGPPESAARRPPESRRG